MNDTPVIRCESLTKEFAGARALDNITLEVHKGELFGLVGPDGAGKSTLMRLLTAVMEPTSGDAWVASHHITREPERIKEKIAYMPQRFGLYEDLTVMENIVFYADIFSVPRNERPSRIERLLGFSNLTPFTDRLAGQLSGGMKQKLGLACALIHTPEIVFLDEPTNGVDPVSRRDFWKILYELLREGVTIFVSTAYLDEAERCTKIGLLHKGRMILSGTPDEVKKHMSGALVEIRCNEPRQVLASLRESMTLVAAGLFGAKIHLVLDGDASQALAAVKEKLATLGVEAETEIVVPSLEDVFISQILSSEGSGSDA